MLDRIDAFWGSFVEHLDAIDGSIRLRSPWSLSPWMDEHLGRVDPGLRWEFGPGAAGGHRLLLSPSKRRLRPLVERVVAQAPPMAGWEVHTFRPREGEHEAALLVEKKLGGSLAGWSAHVTAGEHRSLAVGFGVPGAGSPVEKATWAAADLAAEALLGGEMYERWVGSVGVGPPRENDRPLVALGACAEGVQQALRDALPGRPRSAAGQDWTLFKMNPRKRSHYPGRVDAYTVTTMLPEMTRCAHSRYSFSSERFSRVGEVFAYLKVDFSEGLDEDGFADKRQMEEALDEALVGPGLGCVVGGASGLRYEYIDLALQSPDVALGVVRQVMQEGKVPRASWVLFFDDVWRDEWVGVWPDGPPPP